MRLNAEIRIAHPSGEPELRRLRLEGKTLHGRRHKENRYEAGQSEEFSPRDALIRFEIRHVALGRGALFRSVSNALGADWSSGPTDHEFRADAVLLAVSVFRVSKFVQSVRGHAS